MGDGTLLEFPSETLDVMTALHFGEQCSEHTGVVDPPEDTSYPTQPEKRAEPEWSLDHISSEYLSSHILYSRIEDM